MRIHLAADSTGYDLGRSLERWLISEGHETVWHAAPERDDGDDYPIYAVRVGRAVIADEDAGVPTRGVLVGASGAGEAITANKVPGIRAIPGLGVDFVRLARAHADVDVIALGTRLITEAEARELVTALVTAPFADLLDDARRIVNTNEFESSGTIEGWMIEERSHG